jgi:hypothetical protein
LISVAASRVFNFLQSHESFAVERYELASTAFGSLRRSVRQIVQRFRESEDQEALNISERLRALLSELLTVPVPLDRAIRDNVMDVLGQGGDVEGRWGSDIRRLYAAALRATEDLQAEENPMRQLLREIIRGLRSRERMFKVYCHRRARSHFETLLIDSADQPLPADVFLHSVKDYRETEPFNVLLKVGPLRARGWGSAPDALTNAPRFDTLVQVLWSGCSDEPDFGYDPTDPGLSRTDSRDDRANSAGMNGNRETVKWRVRVTRSGEDMGPRSGPEVDELQLFREMDRLQDKRFATLLQIDDLSGILYPPRSRLLSLDPDPSASVPIDHRIPGEALLEGIFLIRPLLYDASLGPVQAEHGRYSQVWKARLAQAWQSGSFGLIESLRAAGLNLLHLDAAIRHWCRPPSTVIHAPQQARHFQILLTVLGIGEGESGQSSRTTPWWQLAWNEVRRSRGEAISAAFEVHGIVEEKLLAILNQQLPAIRRQASEGRDFRVIMPAGSELSGEVAFHKVRDIEEGFAAPQNELRVVRELTLIDQWRV